MIETILLIFFSILFFWLSWQRTDVALAIIVIFLPSYLIRFALLNIPATLLEIMILIIFGAWLVKKVVQNQKNFTAQIQFPWKWIILLFMLAGTVAVLISPDTRQALGLWKAYLLEPVLFFIIFVNTIKTQRQIRMVIWGLGISVVLIGFVTLLQYVGLVEIPAHYGLEIPKRATSVFPFPTAVGKYVGPIVAFFLGLWLVRDVGRDKKEVQNSKSSTQSNKLGQIFFLGVICFGLMGLILSFSRAALISVFAGLVFVSFFSKWRKWIWLGMITAVLITFLIPQTRNNVVGIVKTTDTSTDVRLVMWKGAWQIIKDNPITGTGLASFPVVYEKYKEASHTEFFPNPDHLILTLWIEMGLAGLVIFSWLIVRFFKTGIRVLKNYRQWSVALLAMMVAFLAHGFLDTPYFKNDLAVEFWLFVGLMVVVNQISESLQKAKNKL